jgi:uncharacterized protein (DUF58 family)
LGDRRQKSPASDGPGGENTRPGRLLTPDIEQRLTALRFHFSRPVDGRLTGVHRSAQPGISVEFSDHKEYSPGDDIRHLNWKVYARSDKFYVRQFAKDTHANIHLVVDLSDSMTYRSSETDQSKASSAARLAVSLTSIFLRQNDAVGLLTIQGNKLDQIVPPRSHASQLVAVEETLQQALAPRSRRSAEGPTSMVSALEYLIISRRLTRSAVIILSDLFVDQDVLFPYLTYLKAGGNFVWLVQVLDPAEFDFAAEGKGRTFPFAGTRVFRSPETGQGVLMESELARPDYVAKFKGFLESLHQRCAENGLEWSGCNSDRDPVEFLVEYLQERK